MRIARAHGQIAELIFTCTWTVMLCAGCSRLATGPAEAADAGLRSRRLKTSRNRQP